MVMSMDTKQRKQASQGAVRKGSIPFVIPLLFIGFILPFYFDILGLQISGYRFVLLVFFIPAMIKWIDGSSRIHTVDILIICFALWRVLSVAINHGLSSRWEFAGINFVEAVAPYFIARWMIRDAYAFRFFVVWLFIVIAMMLPFSAYQFFTDKSILLDFFANLGAYATQHYPPRLGYFRAQGSMPHPILFGIFCSAAFSLVWCTLCYGKGMYFRASRSGVIIAAVFTSLSSGAFLSVTIQAMLMVWSRVLSSFKKKWNMLLYLFASMYVFLDIFANRAPAEIFAAYLTLNSASAWYRIHIFNFAIDDVISNPFFGIGLGYWTRPAWLLSSIDNFWLLVALRGGFPALAFLLIVIILLYRNIGRAQLTGKLASYRYGYLFSLSGICIAAITVHLWDATFCFLMFLLGAGVWMIDAKDEDAQTQTQDSSDPAEDRKIRYTRFEAKQHTRRDLRDANGK